MSARTPVNDVYEHNRRAWDRRAAEQGTFARPAREQAFEHPLGMLDSRGWLGDVRGKRVLCLAAGGGKASVLFAEAGAEVTVVDISPQMLQLDRRVAHERGLHVNAVEASMDDLSVFADGIFDIVSQPVSTCYVPEIEAVYRQVARVIVSGGIYVSQHKQPASLQAEVKPSAGGYTLTQPYYRSGPLPVVRGSRHREPDTREFLHRWEQIIGGLCRAGFVVEDLTEPMHADAQAERGSFEHRSLYAPPYVRIKARRTSTQAAAETERLWVPGQ